MKIIKYLLRLIYTIISIIRIGSYKTIPKVNFYSRFTKNTHLGINTNFNGMIIKGNGYVEISDNFHSGKNCIMINSFHKYDDGNSIPYDSNKKNNKNIFIKENVWFGDNVMILGGVEIEEGAIIQAGAVVVKNVPKYAIVGGNPAKIFKYRNIDHYEKLKKLNKTI